MMRQLLSSKIAAFKRLQKVTPPSGGWLRAIRLAVGMPSSHAARKLRISASTLREFENNEATGAISLKTLKRAADAMDCDLVYFLFPRAGSLQAMIEKQAQKRAEALVRPVAHSMLLEGQSTAAARERIDELSKELAATPNASLWDDA